MIRCVVRVLGPILLVFDSGDLRIRISFGEFVRSGGGSNSIPAQSSNLVYLIWSFPLAG